MLLVVLIWIAEKSKEGIHTLYEEIVSYNIFSTTMEVLFCKHFLNIIG